MSEADAFLLRTDPLYDECSSAIVKMDRISMRFESHLSEIGRSMLFPGLYAVWERFFKHCFNEFLHSLAHKTTLVINLPRELSKAIIKDRISRDFSKKGSLLIGEICTDRKTDPHYFFSTICSYYMSGIQRIDVDTGLIQTYSNVKYDVLQEACNLSALKIDEIKRKLQPKFTLHTDLEDLVDIRNDIAHGGSLAGVALDKWKMHVEFVPCLMNALQLHMHDSLN